MSIDTGPVPLPPLTGRSPAETVPGAQTWFGRLRHAWPSYLPVVMMAALAATTGWLARNTPVPEDVRVAASPSGEPDYRMRGFSVQRYTGNGMAQAVIEGDDTRHYPVGDRLEIDGARLRWVPAAGPALNAEATRATAHAQDDRVRLDGRVRVWQEAAQAGEGALEFRGEEIVMDLARGEVQSDRAVTLRQGESVFQADALRYDHTSQTLTLTGGVRGTLRRPPGP
jgi:lipopolysaccharide export system protein LptC